MVIPGIIAGGRQTAAPPAGNLATEILADNPVWYCRHNETSGTVATNLAPGGANGTYIGTPVFSAAPIYVDGLTCWDTNGVSRVEIPVSVMPAAGVGSITILIMMKRKTNTSVQALIDRDESVRFWQFRFNTTNLEYIKTFSTIQSASVSNVGTTGDSELLVVTVDAVGNVIFYRDGVQIGTGTVSASQFGSNTELIRIGARFSGTDQANMYVAETALYTTVISPARIAVYGNAVSKDASFANVRALLHFDGVDGSTTFTDVKLNTWRFVGSAQLDTAFTKFGPSSCLFTNTDSAIFADSANFAFGTGDFTVEFYGRLPATTGINCNLFYFSATSDAGTPQGGLFANTSGNLIYWNGANLITGSSIVGTTFRHIAVSRNSGTVRLYLDGVLQGSATADATNYTGQFVKAGRFSTGNYVPPFHMDDLRITQGVGRYLIPFTPPVRAFSDS